MSRRLVPMPSKRRRPSGGPAVTQPPPLAPLKTWHVFAFLLVTAVAMYYLKWPILLIAALVGLFRGEDWLDRHYPRAMHVVMAVLWGFFRRR